MLKLVTDVQFTRRKRIHCVFDERDQLIWSGPRFDAALEFVFDSGYDRTTIQGPTSCWIVHFQRSDK